MSWTPLPEDYTDRSWTGLQKYQMITNQDNTVSFNDVTEYTNLADSFFGALQANQITTAINILMAMVESGTDIYEQFHQYFETQKVLFEAEEDELLEGLETDFMAWYNRMKGQLSEDAAGHLQNEIDDIIEEVTKIEFNYYHELCNRNTQFSRSDGKITGWVAQDSEITETVSIVETIASKTMTITIEKGIETWVKTSIYYKGLGTLVESYRKEGGNN